jgi:hypothetical protein
VAPEKLVGRKNTQATPGKPFPQTDELSFGGNQIFSLRKKGF